MAARSTSGSRAPIRATSAVTAELESELVEVAAGCGCELLAAEWKGGVLRLVIDRPEGVSIADCEQVSKQSSALLDVSDFGAGRYVLEVSSPGLDRPLYRRSDYPRFLGRLIRVSFDDPATERKRTVVGRLVDFVERPEQSEQAAEVTVEESAGKRWVLPLDRIRLARLEIELGRDDRK
jgi:ribosome maturation factor RimP